MPESAATIMNLLLTPLALAAVFAAVFAASAAEPAPENSTSVAKPFSLTGPVPEEAVRSARLLRERFLADPHRPTYHFCTPEDMGLPGDPNGAF